MRPLIPGSIPEATAAPAPGTRHVDSLAIADLAEQRHRPVYYRSANARVRRIKERLGSTQP